MSASLYLNQSHYTAGNQSFTYTFPTAQNYKNHEVALTYASINNQWANISQALGNNQVILYMPSQNNNLYIEIDITIQDGYYSSSALLGFFQTIMIQNGLYLISTATGSPQNIYYMDLQVNSVQYIFDFVFYSVPTTLGQYFSLPSGTTWTLPTNNRTPYILMKSQGLGQNLGYSSVTYPNTTGAHNNYDVQLPSSIASQGSSFNVTCPSNLTPYLNTVSSLLLTCNLINNIGISIPTSVIATIPISTVGYGSTALLPSVFPIYQKVASNTYTSIIIGILDQDGNQLSLIDTDAIFSINIRPLPNTNNSQQAK